MNTPSYSTGANRENRETAAPFPPLPPVQKHELTLPNSARTYRVLDEVAAERARQHLLLQSGAIPFNCADPAVDLRDKLPVLMEKVSEVATAMMNAGPPDSIARRLMLEAVHEELLQLAAVAVAIAESLSPIPNRTGANRDNGETSAFKS